MVFCNTLQLLAFCTRWTAFVSLFALTSVYYFHLIILLNAVTRPPPPHPEFPLFSECKKYFNLVTENLASVITLIFWSSFPPLTCQWSLFTFLDKTNCFLFCTRKINAYLLRSVPVVQTAQLMPSELSLRDQWDACWNSPKVALLC